MRENADTLISGTYVLTLERSHQGYRLNRMCASLTDPARRASFLADEAAYMRGMGMAAPEIDMVRRRDWAAMTEAGGSIYLMLKIAGTIGQTLLQMGAQMRGETLEAFMTTRPGMKVH